MNGKQLKNSILQWAIQGKLVPQNPKDEPASKLLERIAAQRIVASGAKQSKKNPASRIYREGSSWFEQVGSAEPKDITEEIPFDIPESWEWCRLESLGETLTGSTPSKSNPAYFGNFIPFLSPGDILNSRITYGKQGLSQEGRSVARPTPSKTILQVCIGGSIGKCAITDRETTFNQQINSISICIADEYYVFSVMSSDFFQRAMKDHSSGTATPIINKSLWDKLLLPLPPLAEQKRIVKKLEQILPLVDEYDQAQTQLDKLNKELPEALKKSILQQAIQGKLVPQNPKDEPADKLLERITISRHSEHSEESSKKSRKSSSKNPVSRIYRDTDGLWYEQIGSSEPVNISEEIPFEIPETWTWCRLKDISVCNLGKTLNQGTDTGLSKGYLCSINVYWKGIDLSKVKIAKFESAELEKYRLQKGDLLICEGGDIGRSCIWNNDEEMYYQNALHRVRFFSEIQPTFYLQVLYLYKCLGFLDDVSKGVTIKHLTQDSINKLVFPLPPLAEQKRIVAKLEQLFKAL